MALRTENIIALVASLEFLILDLIYQNVPTQNDRHNFNPFSQFLMT